MEIRVETGREEQRKEIANELGMLAEASKHYQMAFTVAGIEVPEDFDARVNVLQNTDSFRSTPGMEPVSKTVATKNGVHILFHPKLFTGAYDNHVRYSIYWHEFSLLVNKGRFPVLLRHPLDRFANYFINLYQLFDQYDALRKSFEFRDALVKQVLGEELSALARKDVEQSLAGQLAIIRNKAEYYDWFRFQIAEFREHGNVQQYLDMVRNKMAQLSFAIVLAYATMDHYEYLRDQESLIAKAPMLDNNTREFLEYFRRKYQEGSPDLTDGLDVMEAFWANFGIRFMDGQVKLQCEVLDI